MSDSIKRMPSSSEFDSKKTRSEKLGGQPEPYGSQVNEETAANTSQPPFTDQELIMLRKLINTLCHCSNPSSLEKGSAQGDRVVYRDREVVKEVIKEIPVEKEVIVEKIVQLEDPIRKSIAPMAALIAFIRTDEELNATWLEGVDDEGFALIKLTAILSQWNQIETLWDKLANRCKQQQRALLEQELALLNQALTCYNLTLSSRQAKLQVVEIGSFYDYETQQRGTATGDAITATWIPALVNAAGKTVKKPVVATK